MRRHSLLTRLTLSHVLVTLAGTTLLITTLLLLAGAGLRQATQADLASRAQVMALYAAEIAPDSATLAAIAADLPRRFLLEPGMALRVFAPNGNLLFASSDLGPFPSAAVRPLLTSPLPLQPLARETDRRFVAQAVTRNGQPLGVIELSQSIARERKLLTLLALALLPSTLLALIGAALAGHLLARSLVRPLARLRQVATAIAGGELQTRSDDRSHDEIGQLAAQLNRMADELQARLAEVERLATARQEFYRAVSHELRTPLTAIRGMAENLEDDATPAQRAGLAVIQQEALRLQDLVEELLRPGTAGPIPLRHRQALDIAALISEVCRIMQPRALRAGVALHYQVQGELPIRGDRDRLKQALLNLIDNALIWTPPGGQVRLSARRDATTIQIQVCDTGPGIPPQLGERVWERGVSTSGGQGLGLALVREVAQAHGGSAHLLPGAGATVELRLPAADRPDAGAQTT